MSAGPWQSRGDLEVIAAAWLLDLLPGAPRPAAALCHPIVLRRAQALLDSSLEGRTAYVESDLRDTSAIITEAARTLDFGAPIALMLLIIVHLIPESDDPYGIVATLAGALPAGSYLVLAHPASDIRAASMAEMTKRLHEPMSGPRAATPGRAAAPPLFPRLEPARPRLVPPGPPPAPH